MVTATATGRNSAKWFLGILRGTRMLIGALWGRSAKMGSKGLTVEMVESTNKLKVRTNDYQL